MPTLIKFKRGLESSIKQEILEKGEPTFSLDTHKLFVGDGVIPGGHLIGGNSLSYGGNRPIIYCDDDIDAGFSILYAIDTTNKIVTVTFPEDPPIGAEIRIIDIAKNFDVNRVVLNGNGKLIEGSLNNYYLDEVGAYILNYGLDGEQETWFVLKVSGEKWFDSDTKDSWTIRYLDSGDTASNMESLLVDTTIQTITVGTPINPIPGYKFQIQDYNNTWDIHPVTVSIGVSETFKCGTTQNLTFDEKGLVVTFIYDVCPNGDFSWSVKVGRNLIPQDNNVDNWMQNGAEHGDIFIWDATEEKWIVGQLVIEGFNFSDFYSGTDDQMLIFDGNTNQWIVTDVNKAFDTFYSGEDGQILVYNETLHIWEIKDLNYILDNFYEGTENNQVLLWTNEDVNQKWEVGNLTHEVLTGKSGIQISTDSGIGSQVIKTINTDDQGHITNIVVGAISSSTWLSDTHTHDAYYAVNWHSHSGYYATLPHKHYH